MKVTISYAKKIIEAANYIKNGGELNGCEAMFLWRAINEIPLSMAHKIIVKANIKAWQGFPLVRNRNSN